MMMMATSQVRRQRRTPCEPSCSVAAADHLLLRPSVRCDVEARKAVSGATGAARADQSSQSQVDTSSRVKWAGGCGIRVRAARGCLVSACMGRTTTDKPPGLFMDTVEIACIRPCMHDVAVRVCVSSGTFAHCRSFCIRQRHQTNEKYRIAFSGTNGTQAIPSI